MLALLVSFLACRALTPPTREIEPPAPDGSSSIPGAEREAPTEPALVAPGEPLSAASSQPVLVDIEQRPVPMPVRVGLDADLSEVVLPCCAEDLEARSLSAAFGVTGELRILPDPEAVAKGVYRLQVTALRDPQQAEELAARLRQITGLPGDARFDAASGLFRVRVGRFATRVEAERARPGLAVHGVSEAWIVGDGGGVENPALRVEHQGKAHRFVGRWLALSRRDGGPVAYQDRRYRGRLLVYLNDRGSLTVTNELPLEEYLRSVVAREMGPGLYPELEALKAQAVAARTYTLRNLGEFEEEGYDICATPRCQVYSGVAAEHPLSDRAVEETAGEVLLWQGELADTLYSATCGGHTEDVQIVFPLKREAYLRGVPCIEAGASRLAATDREEALRLALAERPDDVERIEARFQSLSNDAITVRDATGAIVVLPIGPLATFDGTNGESRPGALALLPGDVLRLYLEGGRLAGVEQLAPAADVRLERRGQRGEWSRFRSKKELARRVQQRIPGFELASLEVLQRGVSGRVGKLVLRDNDGRREVVAGLAVRWTLDLPDTRFSFTPATRGSEPGWTFTGRGWGHGVGLCQVGAFGMAQRGHQYSAILDHYYTGLTLGRMSATRRLSRQVAGG